MAKQTWLTAAYFVGALDLTSQQNRGEAESMVEEKDVTTFGSNGAKEVIGGLETVTVSAGGFVDWGSAYDIDREQYDNKRLVLPHTFGVSNSGSAVGAVAYLVKALQTTMKFGTSVGEVLPWELAASGSSAMSRGKFLVSPSTAVTATADGTAVEVGAVSSAKKLYVAQHVLARTGTATLDTVIESDVDALFDGSETTRATLTQVSSTGWQFTSVAGPITDTYYRAAMTVGGSGSLTVAIAVGISLF